MKMNNVRNCVLAVLLVSFMLLPGCELVSRLNMGGDAPIKNRGNREPSIFHKQPMEHQFAKAISARKERAMDGIHQIHQALEERQTDMWQLKRAYELMMQSHLLPEVELYGVYIISQYPPPSKIVLGRLEDLLGADNRQEIYQFETYEGEQVRGKLENWVIKAMVMMLKPELDTIYSSTTEIQEINEMPFRQNRKILREWLSRNYGYLTWSESEGGFVVDRRRKRREQIDREDRVGY